MATNKMTNKVTTVKLDNISKDRTTFEMYCGGKFQKDIHMDLLKNKKVVLEAIATRVLFDDITTVKKFRETKPKLVEKILTLLRFETPEDPDDWEKVGYDTPDDYNRSIKSFWVPKGEYYHGDLCYDLKNSIYDKIWCGKFNCEMGVYRRKSDGAVFGMFDTEGDGCWKEHYGNKEYCVDAGNLGIASKVLCYGEEVSDDYITFDRDEECWAGYSEDEGCQMFVFGHVEISDKHYRDDEESDSEDEEDDY